MADPDDELVEAVRELTRTIDDLRQELESTGRGRLGPPALRPPTPRDLLRLTDEVALPAAIAVLETSVRALEGFQRAVRLARTEREVRDRTSEAASATSERASDLRRTTLSRLDTVLTELQRAASDGTLPADDRAAELLSEARELREDVDRRLRDVGDDVERRTAEADADATGADAGSTDAIRIDIEEGGLEDRGADGASDPDRDDDTPGVDVDAELETLKDQYGAEEGEENDENDENGDSSGSRTIDTDADTGGDAIDAGNDGEKSDTERDDGPGDDSDDEPGSDEAGR